MKYFAQSIVILTFLLFGFLLVSSAHNFDPQKYETIELDEAKIISPKSLESACELKETFKDIAAKHTKRSAEKVEFETIDFHGIKNDG